MAAEPCDVNVQVVGNEQVVLREHGLSVLSAAIFVAAEMIGSGILALPKAIVQTGWIGVVLLVIFCFNAGFIGSRLGDCWTILEERYPIYRDSTRNPYPSIASVALGTWGRHLVSVCIQLTLFGVGTVFLLLASEIFQELLKTWIPDISAKYWFLAFACASCVPMWLGSPKDFWLLGFGAFIATVLSCLCIFIQICRDGSQSIAPQPAAHSLDGFFMAFGTIMFAFGGASTFPTIQNDMLDRNQFHKSVKIAFTILLCIYLPITISAYVIYGESAKNNIINSLSSTPFTVLANVFMGIHLILAFFIIINPVSQELEEIFHVPNKFCIKRCILRTMIVCIMILIGLTIPNFEKILALIGGSTITLLTFVLPPYFYMKLCDQTDERTIPLFLRTYMWELIAVGFVGGIAVTVSAVKSIITQD